jgi:hypothetical protein
MTPCSLVGIHTDISEENSASSFSVEMLSKQEEQEVVIFMFLQNVGEFIWDCSMSHLRQKFQTESV